MKKLLPLFLVAFLFVACNSNSNKSETDTKAATEVQAAVVETDVMDFLNNQQELVGQTVNIKGDVAHVCAHGGKRLFLMHPDTVDRVKITAGEDIPAFKTELEGSVITVTGVVEELRVTPEYLDNWQAELEAGADGEESEKKIHTGEDGHEHHEGDMAHELEQINNYRTMLEENDKEFLSFISIDCKKIVEHK